MKIKNLYDLLKIDFPSDENAITSTIEYELLNYIYKFGYYPNLSHMLSVLTHSEYNDRLTKYVDEDIVAHKIELMTPKYTMLVFYSIIALT